MSDQSGKDSLNVDEAAQFLKVSRQRLLDELRIGRVPAFRDEKGRWRFDRLELTEYVEQHQPKPAPGATISLRPKTLIDEAGEKDK
jgi:excisionase family DNA binding protein